MALLLAALAGVRSLPCPHGLLPMTAAAGHPCLNGSPGYVPIVAAMAIVAVLLRLRAHPAWRGVALASLTFAVSLAMRTIDIEVCALTSLLGRPRGTHALWHLLNGLAVYFLLVTALRRTFDPNSAHPTRRLACGLAIARLRVPRHKGFPAADVVEPVDTQDLKS